MIFAVNKAMHTNPSKPNIVVIAFPNNDSGIIPSKAKLIIVIENHKALGIDPKCSGSLLLSAKYITQNRQKNHRKKSFCRVMKNDKF